MISKWWTISVVQSPLHSAKLFVEQSSQFFFVCSQKMASTWRLLLCFVMATVPVLPHHQPTEALGNETHFNLNFQSWTIILRFVHNLQDSLALIPALRKAPTTSTHSPTAPTYVSDRGSASSTPTQALAQTSRGVRGPAAGAAVVHPVKLSQRHPQLLHDPREHRQGLQVLGARLVPVRHLRRPLAKISMWTLR